MPLGMVVIKSEKFSLLSLYAELGSALLGTPSPSSASAFETAPKESNEYDEFWQRAIISSPSQTRRRTTLKPNCPQSSALFSGRR